jgi:hypothetical protein
VFFLQTCSMSIQKKGNMKLKHWNLQWLGILYTDEHITQWQQVWRTVNGWQLSNWPTDRPTKQPTNQPNPWSRAFLDKPIIPKLVKKSPHFLEPEGSLLCSQQPASCPYLEPVVSSPLCLIFL